MKSNLPVVGLILVFALCVSCQNKKQPSETILTGGVVHVPDVINPVKNNDLNPEQQMSGRKTQLLYGNVKKAVCSDGSLVEFNKDGNVVLLKENSGTVHKYSYANANRYTLANEPYNIVFNDSVRFEVWDNPEKLSTDYVFDTVGRLKENREMGYGESTGTQYHYRGNELLPFKITKTIYWETGQMVITSVYSYTQIDTNGNWLVCKVEMTTESEEYDDFESDNAQKTVEKESKTLTRTLEYY